MENYGKTEFATQFRNRTKKFVVDNIRFYRTLPKTDEGKIIGKQLLRSSSSVGSNYRAACRARSQGEFYSKLSIVVEEADESVFWMEVMEEADVVKPNEVFKLKSEALEILKVLSTARKTIAEKNIKRK